MALEPRVPLLPLEVAHAAADGAPRPAPKSSITSMVNCGLEGFVKAMALELGPVRVNVISPGIVDSGPFWSRLTPET